MEKELLSERFPKITFVRTMKQDSKRGHYYCTEERGAMRYLEEIRRKNVIEEHPPKKDFGKERRPFKNSRK